MHPIQTMIERYHAGQHAGIYSCCCANELVIRAVMQQALRCGSEVLIEATANQVNQDGGYTGMTLTLSTTCSASRRVLAFRWNASFSEATIWDL